MISDLYEYIETQVMSAKNDNTENTNLIHIDSGHYRTVYRINTSQFGKQYKGCVVKIAGYSRSETIDANRYEFKTWMTVKGTDMERYFCPILDRSYDYRILVMEYAQDYNLSSIEDLNFRKELKQHLDIRSPPSEDQQSLDIRPNNIRLYNGRKVLVDYPWGANFERKMNK